MPELLRVSEMMNPRKIPEAVSGAPGDGVDNLLLEDGSNLLLEDGGVILLEA